MKNMQSAPLLITVILVIILGVGGYYFIGRTPAPRVISTTATTTASATATAKPTVVSHTKAASEASVQTAPSHVDWTAPGYVGTLVTIDTDSLHSKSGNPILRGTAKGFGSLNISIISNDRDGASVFNMEPIPVKNEQWSVELVPKTFRGSGNVFNDNGTLSKGSYNIQILPGPTSVASSLINATLIVDGQ